MRTRCIYLSKINTVTMEGMTLSKQQYFNIECEGPTGTMIYLRTSAGDIEALRALLRRIPEPQAGR